MTVAARGFAPHLHFREWNMIEVARQDLQARFVAKSVDAGAVRNVVTLR